MGKYLQTDGHATEKQDITAEVMMLYTIHFPRKIVTETRSWQSEMRC